MQCFKNTRRDKASSSLKAFMPLTRKIVAVSVLPLKAQLESSGREGKMVKPEGASGSSASCSNNRAPWRHLQVGGMMCGWRRRLKVTAPNFAFTLKCERNCSGLTVAESRCWHYLPFVVLPIRRLKLCSPAEFEWPLHLKVRQVCFFLSELLRLSLLLILCIEVEIVPDM